MIKITSVLIIICEDCNI